MKKIYSVFILFVFIIGIKAQDYIVTNNYTIASGVEETWVYDSVLVSGQGNIALTIDGKLTVKGSLTDDDLVIINTSGALIIEGDLTLTNTQSTLNGNIIVLGNVYLKNTDMLGSANLVVGGTISADQGNLNGVEGDVFILDPDVNPNPPELPNGQEKDLSDLIEESLTDPYLKELVDEILNSPVNIYNWAGPGAIWDVGANWDKNELPDTINSVIIPTSVTQYPDLCDTKIFVMWNLTLEDGASLTIPEGSQVTIYGDIVIHSNANFIVENSSTNPTSFIHYGSLTGDVTVNWQYDPMRYWYIGHAISNPTFLSYDNAMSGNNEYKLYHYPAGSWVDITSIGDGFSEPIKGYSFIMRYDYGDVISHTGTLNNNAVYSKILNGGWELIANPYASYYQLPKQDASGADFEHTTGSVYVRTGDAVNRTLAVFNTLNGISTPEDFTGIIAPSQSFWVEDSDGVAGGDVYMRAANRIHDGARSSLKSAKASDVDILRIKLRNDVVRDEAVVAFREGGSDTFTRMDSEQRFETGNKMSYIYSVVEDMNAVINVLPMDMEGDSIVLGLKALAGNHSIFIEGVNTLTEDYELVLKDNLLGVETTMDVASEYDFVSEDGTYNDRFVIYLKTAEVSTDINNMNFEVSDNISVYISDKSTLIVNCDWDVDDKRVCVASITGRVLLNEEFNADVFTKELNFKPGVYIVKVAGETRSYEQKVFVK